MPRGYDSASASPDFQNGAVTGAFGYLFNSLAHSYSYREQVCSNSDAACSTGAVWDALKHNAYPGQDPSTTVGNNGHYYVMDSPQEGAITVSVDEATMTITNTTAGTHIFCCGFVSLQVIGTDEGVDLSIIGRGSNTNWFTLGFNYAASVVFPTWQVNRIGYTMDSSYFARTGSWPMGSSFAPPGTATSRPPGPPW